MREPSPRRRTGCSTCSTGSGSPPPSGASRTAWCSTPATVAYLSAAEVAELAGVSQPSVTRFAVALGHDGYPALRRRLRELTAAGPGSPRRRQRTATRGTRRDGEPGTAGRQLADRDKIAPPAGCSPQPPAAGARPARRRAAGRLLRVLRRQGAPRRPGPRRRRQPAHRPARTGRASAGADALLAFVLPRYPRETLDALRAARDAGLTVVAITDSPVSPAAESADWCSPPPSAPGSSSTCTPPR